MSKRDTNNQYPYFSFQWHITDRCDQRCKHCYIYSDSNKRKVDEMTFSQMRKILEYCIDFCERVSCRPNFFITGGDPLLHPDFWKLAQLLKDKQLPFSLMGNPYHLTEDNCKLLKELGCKQYQMSIDGLRETHDKIRKNGSFDKTFEVIPYLLNAGIFSSIMTTVSSMNINEIPQIMEIVARHNVSLYAFARYCPVDKTDEIGISPEQYRQLFDDYLDKACELYQKGYKTIFGKKDHLWSLYEYELVGKDFPDVINFVNRNNGCGCGGRQLAIFPSGDILACPRMHNSIVGSVWDNDLDDIWLNRMEHYRHYEKFEKCSKCELLSVCRGCPAVGYASSKKFYGADPQCWKKV